MRAIVAGSRWIHDGGLVAAAIEASGFTVRVLIHGGAPGVDSLAGAWAQDQGLEVLAFPVTAADWKRLGKRAGPLRNGRMIREGQAEALVAVWDGRSRGTADMIRQAEEAGLALAIFLTNAPFPRRCDFSLSMEAVVGQRVRVLERCPYQALPGWHLCEQHDLQVRLDGARREHKQFVEAVRGN